MAAAAGFWQAGAMYEAGDAIVAVIVIAAVAGVVVRSRRTPEVAWAAVGSLATIL